MADLLALRRFPTSSTDATSVLGDPGTAPPQPVVLPRPVVPPYGSSLESGWPRASLKSGRTFSSHELEGADPRTVQRKLSANWLNVVVLRARVPRLLVAVAVSRPGAPVPLSLGALVF